MGLYNIKILFLSLLLMWIVVVREVQLQVQSAFEPESLSERNTEFLFDRMKQHESTNMKTIQ